MEHKYLTEAVVIEDYTTLLSDGDEDIVFCGYNIENKIVIGSIMRDDCEFRQYTHLHSIISHATLNQFRFKEISYLEVLKQAERIYMLITNYSKTCVEICQMKFEDIGEEYMPLENSFLI